MTLQIPIGWYQLLPDDEARAGDMFLKIGHVTWSLVDWDCGMCRNWVDYTFVRKSPEPVAEKEWLNLFD